MVIELVLPCAFGRQICGEFGSEFASSYTVAPGYIRISGWRIANCPWLLIYMHVLSKQLLPFYARSLACFIGKDSQFIALLGPLYGAKSALTYA